MRLEFEVELPDAPGQLQRLLRTVANHGGNVQSVVHRHEKATDGRVPVLVAVEVAETEALRLLDALARNHRLLRVNREGGPARAVVLLTGHVFEANLKQLLDEVFRHHGQVERVDARIEGRSNPSAVLLQLSADDEASLEESLVALRKHAAQSHVALYEEVRDAGPRQAAVGLAAGGGP